MSSNAFARSRPRVRHQRVPRTTNDHPRFLQLVNELARINEAKKKQEEAEGISGAVDCSEDDSGGGGNGGAGSNSSCLMGSIDLSGSASCCTANVPQTSNGYRSLDSNQSTSALQDNYHQLPQHHHHHHHHHHQQQNHQHNQNHQHQELQQHLSNNLQQHDDRCAGKNSSTNFGYSKQMVVEQNNSDFSSNNPDLRQDENRSKRKRSGYDHQTARKSTTATCVSGGGSKRHKSSPEATRPLSPSFTKCPICLLDSMDRDPSFTNTCFHLFCYVCIENWTKNKATCPLCRTKFTKIIYNIRSATSYDEKVASPIRRDDDDGFMANQLMLDHFSSINPNSSASNRNPNSDDVQFLFENFRNPEVLMPQYFVNQMDSRPGESLHSFNTVTPSTNFNSNVPHPPFTPTSYPITSNYILFNNRIAPVTSTAITSAYTANTSLTNINNDPSNRRVSRSGRFMYSRNYETQNVDAPTRVSRTLNTSILNQPSVPLERHHHHQHQHQHQILHQHHHQLNQHRSTLDVNPRQNQRVEQSHLHIQLPYQIQARHYNTNPYPRRSYNNPQVEQQHLLDTLYRQMPDM